MSIIEQVKDTIKSTVRPLGYEIIEHRNVFRDVKVGHSSVVFDVGANEGQTIELAFVAMRAPVIHAFEPTKTAFTILSKRFPEVHLNNCALGPVAGFQEIKEGAATTMSSLLEPAEHGWDGRGWKGVASRYNVPVRTVDEYCAENRIERIDVFKTDTQGYDLQVLSGAERMFSERRIRYIFTEITFPQMYEGQAMFDDMYCFLKERGFILAGVYNARAGDMNALFSLVGH